MNTCKTCKWWGRVREGCCDFVDTLHSAKPATRFEIYASADDDHNLQAYLLTGPDFGCIHHEARS
jgi:hypothetical protein